MHSFSQLILINHYILQNQALIKAILHKNNKKYNQLISSYNSAKVHLGSKHLTTSLERLQRQALGKRSIIEKDPITNIVKSVALKHFIPYGLDDFEKTTGDITFKIAKGKEKRGILRKIKKGDLYYKDATTALGAKFDYWKNSNTKIASDSTTALIHFESLPPISSAKLKSVAKETANLVKTYCNAEIQLFFLNEDTPEAVIEW